MTDIKFNVADVRNAAAIIKNSITRVKEVPSFDIGRVDYIIPQSHEFRIEEAANTIMLLGAQLAREQIIKEAIDQERESIRNKLRSIV